MDFRGELSRKCICQNQHLSFEEAMLCKRMKNLTKERDELISEERDLEIAMKQRKETGSCGKNIKARVRSILNHPSPKNIATELTPLNILEKKKRNVSANLTILGRQLVALDQQITTQRDESLAELDKKEFEVQDSDSDSSDESVCRVIVEFIH